MDEHHQQAESTRRASLGRVLAVVMAIALVMGPGVGVYLVNPSLQGDGPPARVLGMPVVYAWALLWYAVMAVTVITAATLVWSRDEPLPEQGKLSDSEDESS